MQKGSIVTYKSTKYVVADSWEEQAWNGEVDTFVELLTVAGRSRRLVNLKSLNEDATNDSELRTENAEGRTVPSSK